MKKETLMKLIKKPHYLIVLLGYRGFFKWMSDETYLKIAYSCKFDKKLNLQNPTTFNEKLQWLKLNDRNHKYTMFVDKYEVRRFIEKKIGKKYLIPLLGVWKDVEEINFDELPNQFVLKCTHDSGSLVICNDKSKLDLTKVKKKLNKFLKRNYYWGGREWGYRNINPRIIAEKYMVDESGTELKDYKFFCFNGTPKIIQVDFDRFKSHKRNLYNTNWEYIPAALQYPTEPQKRISKPQNLDEMLRLAELLSENIPFLRVDFYSINDRVFFGELTFFPGSGHEKFYPEKYDDILGDWLQLT